MKEMHLKTVLFLLGRVYHNILILLSCLCIDALSRRINSKHFKSLIQDIYILLAHSWKLITFSLTVITAKKYNESQYTHHFLYSTCLPYPHITRVPGAFQRRLWHECVRSSSQMGPKAFVPVLSHT